MAETRDPQPVNFLIVIKYTLFTDCDACANTNFGAKWKFKFSFELENAWEGAKRTRATRQSTTRAAPWRPPPT